MRKLHLLLLLLLLTTYSGGCKTNDQQSENIYYTCKIWGFLKYYHPAVTNGNYDYDEELFKVLDKIKNVKTKESRNKVLLEWIVSFGEITAFQEPCNRNLLSCKQVPNHEWLNNKKEFGQKLSKALLKVKDAKRNERSNYIATSHLGVPMFINEKNYANIEFKDNKYSLLALFRLWNVIEYFYPYKYLLDDNWDNVLRDYIPIFSNIKNIDEYYLNISKLAAEINDFHVRISPKSNQKNFYKTLISAGLFGQKKIPVKLEKIEDKIVVVSFYDKECEDCSLKIGDQILMFDNVEIEDIEKRHEPYAPMANKTTGYYKYIDNILISEKDSVLIKCIRKDKVLDLYAKCVYPKYDAVDDTISYKLLNNDIGYINMKNLRVEEMERMIYSFMNHKGIIIDLRDYPGDYMTSGLVNYLVPNKTLFAKFTRPDITKPGYFKYVNNDNAGYVGYENTEYYKGDVIILVGNRTISQAETFAMSFSKAPKAKIIGSQTVGSNGNITQLSLPGDLCLTFSSIGVYYPDKGETQRIGVRIDEIVKQTIMGIREGRDEVLERAIEILNSNEKDS